MHEIATQRSGQCLATEYNGLTSPLSWQCAKGHVWQARPHSVIYDKTWCPKCFDLKRGEGNRFSREEVSEKALKLGYTLLGKIKNTGTVTLFLHNTCNTKFEASFYAISKKNGNPCPLCNGGIRLSRESAEEYAKARGGQLRFWGGIAASRSQWSCMNGHEWHGKWSVMSRTESWCRKCRSVGSSNGNGDSVQLRLAKKSFGGYISYDKKRGFASDIGLDDVILAKQSPCHYCKVRIATGFDRKDNSLGHTKQNCVPACIRCNWTRGSHLRYEVMVRVGKLLAEIDP